MHAPADKTGLVANRRANQTASWHEIVRGIAVGLRGAHQTMSRHKVVRGLGCGGADGSGDDYEGCDYLGEVFHGISFEVGCKLDRLHG